MLRGSMKEENKSVELKKHVGLIHSANKLSLVERKIANALLYNAYDRLQDQEEHRIRISDLSSLIGYNSKDEKLLKKALVSLISTVLEWNLVDKTSEDQSKVWHASAMLADAKIDGPMCTYSYSKRMRELCYYPEFYGRLNMAVLSRFKSSYGLALYENCIRYQKIHKTPWFDMETYRKLMGVGEGRYSKFRDFNRRVLQPAIDEVNEYSTIEIELELEKINRVVNKLRFKISRKDQDTPRNKGSIGTEGCKEKAVDSRLRRDYGLSAKQIEGLRKEYGEPSLLEKMDMIEASRPFKAGKILNMGAYVTKALQDDYQVAKSSAKATKPIVEVIREQEEGAKKKELIEKYQKYREKNVMGLYGMVPKERQEKIVASFEVYISRRGIYGKIYSESGLENPIIRSFFTSFIAKGYPDIMSSLLSFDEFCLESV